MVLPQCRQVWLCLLVTVACSCVSANEFGVSRRNLPVATPSSYQYTAPTAPQPYVPPPAPSAGTPAPKVASQVTVAPVPTPVSTEAASHAQAPLPGVVRLIAFDQTGQSFGSGAYIGNYGEYGLILSNWHVVCEADGLVHIHFSNGFSSYGAIITADKKWDLALIAVSRPPQSVPLLPVARVLPKPGESLWIAGYGSGAYRLAGGRCVRYLAPEIPQDGSAPLYEIIELSVSARQGDSGGPILNANGELAGVLFGSDMIRNTAGSGCERVNRFLSQAHPMLASLPQQPENHFLSIERGGPKRGLKDSRWATVEIPKESPRVEAPFQRNADFAGSSSHFGVRGSRRYVQPSTAVPAVSPSIVAPKTAVEYQPPQQQPIQQPPQLPGLHQPALTPAPATTENVRPEPGILTAVWETNPPRRETPAIRQTGHQVSFVDRSSRISITDRLDDLKPLAERTVTKKPPRGTMTVSERSDTLPRLIPVGASILALFLVSISISLLKKEG